MILALAILMAGAAVPARAQGARLPAPDKVVGDFLKALGGRGRVASLRDATYEWAVRRGEDAGTARTRLKSSGALRTDFLLPEGERDEAANSRTALSTLTDRRALSARLRAQLESAWFADYRRRKVLARTAAREVVDGAPAYAVEFTTRAVARLRYWFGEESKLLLWSEDEASGTRVSYGDWRAREGSPLLLEPHRLVVAREGERALTLTLTGASYNVGLEEALFEPPADATLDIPALLRELVRNQEEADKRVNEYTFTRKVTRREVDDRGQLKKERISVYEIYPVVGHGSVRKLISEDSVPLTPEREAKEQRRVAEELEKAEREEQKLEKKRERKRAERRAQDGEKGDGEGEHDEAVGALTFLRACEFFSPRRERFRDRDVIVFDFRPRLGFRPANRAESLVSKLGGVIWIDPAERQIMRLEAGLLDSLKRGGGMLATIKSGSAVIFERTRMGDGVWLPRFSQLNLSARVLVFSGVSVNETHEFSNYKRFSTKSGDEKLDAPKEEL